MDTEIATEYKTETVPLTLELAKHFNRMATLKGDRNPDTPKGGKRVGYLHETLRAGLFHSPVWSVVIVSSEKGKKYRIDGGHSSRMLVQAGVDFPENLFVTIRYFKAPNIKAAIELYEQFNVSISTRTLTDLIKNRSAYQAKIEDVRPAYIKTAIYGLAAHFSLRNPEVGAAEALDYIELYPDFIKWASDFVKKYYLRRSGVVGSMVSTYTVSESLSTQFWQMVRDETATTPECPTRILARFLQDSLIDKNKQVKWTKRALYVKCHHAWNAWRDGGKTKLKYTDGVPLPNPK